jgi:hypothetical protein
LLLWGADADEVNVGELDGRRQRGGETQPAGRDLLGQQVRQSGLEERHSTGLEGGNLVLVDVHADDIVPQCGHRGGMRGA